MSPFTRPHCVCGPVRVGCFPQKSKLTHAYPRRHQYFTHSIDAVCPPPCMWRTPGTRAASPAAFCGSEPDGTPRYAKTRAFSPSQVSPVK